MLQRSALARAAVSEERKRMNGRLGFLLSRLRERLWVRPLVFCILSVAGVFVARLADKMAIDAFVPEVDPDSIETLLSIMAASMLVIATFAVASMVSAYASASGTATPRSFPLVLSDDVSQNALSVFIGAFIFSIVALVTLKNGYFARAGNFALFAITLGVFAWVVLTFVRWVDKIARLGRLGATIDKVEAAAANALARRRRSPNLGGVPVDSSLDAGTPVYGRTIGYVQHINVSALQNCAEKLSIRVTVAALPGAFAAPGNPLAYLVPLEGDASDVDTDKVVSAFEIGGDRVYHEDPRFGLIALSEIAGRALSPAVNDPGTAIDIVGTFLRLFASWVEPLGEDEAPEAKCNLVHIPELSLRDMFDDAFTAIARDGAGAIEVQVRLQKALAAMATLGNEALTDAARVHSRLALARAEVALDLAADREVLTAAAQWSSEQS
jgi:uncharacterized membrane protein